MRREWLTIVRMLLRGLKSAQNANPQRAELEQLHITIHQRYESAGLQNVEIITDFITSDDKRGSTQAIVLMFDLLLRCTSDYCSKDVASVLGAWIGDNLL